MKFLKLLSFVFLFFTQITFSQVNLNTANKVELTAIPGIGDAKAQAIIKYRKANGKFKSIEEVKSVSGIGDKLFATIKKNGVLKGKTDLSKIDSKPAKTKSKKATKKTKKKESKKSDKTKKSADKKDSSKEKKAKKKVKSTKKDKKSKAKKSKKEK